MTLPPAGPKAHRTLVVRLKVVADKLTEIELVATRSRAEGLTFNIDGLSAPSAVMNDAPRPEQLATRDEAIHAVETSRKQQKRHRTASWTEGCRIERVQTFVDDVRLGDAQFKFETDESASLPCGRRLQLTHTTRAAINAVNARKRIMFSREIAIVLACGHKGASRGYASAAKQGLIHDPDISVTIR